MENYLAFPFSSCSDTLSPENDNKRVQLGYNSNDNNKMSSAASTNDNGFLGLMLEMERVDNHQGNLQPSTTTSTVFDNNNNNNNNNKMGVTSKRKAEKKVKKAKYAFQTRSQVDILDDGYRWRKYGQKAVKNNKFPRSYYRCTYQGCNVKKQVQRLTRDEGIVVTTYEGIHSHSIDKSTDNFENILTQMQIYTTSF